MSPSRQTLLVILAFLALVGGAIAVFNQLQSGQQHLSLRLRIRSATVVIDVAGDMQRIIASCGVLVQSQTPGPKVVPVQNRPILDRC